jgi:hypothetical protein
VQYRDGHIPTCFNKGTRELFMLCIVCFVPVIIHNCCSLFIYLCLLFIICRSFILFVVRLFYLFYCLISFLNDSLLLLFVVHCFKEKSSILTLDYVQVFRPHCSSTQHHLYESINIILQTPPTLS